MNTYRAAYHYDPASNGVGVVLTLPEHATLSDDALRSEARETAMRARLLDDGETIEDFMEKVIVGERTD